MRNARALLLAICVLIALVIFLLFALLRQQHHTIATVVSSQGLVGGMAAPGDTLVFTTLYPGDPGYTVHFNFKPYPCGNDAQDIPVTASNPGTCTVVSQKPDTPVYFFYSIKLNTSQPVKPDVRPKQYPYSVVPCKLCSTIMNSDNENASQLLAKTSSSHPTATISCNGGTATVTPADVSQNGSATLGWIAASSWRAYAFLPSAIPACSNSNDFSSSGTYAQCQINPNATGKYTYSVHLDGCATDGTDGQLNIH